MESLNRVDFAALEQRESPVWVGFTASERRLFARLKRRFNTGAIPTRYHCVVGKPWYARALEARQAEERRARAELAGALSSQVQWRVAAFSVSRHSAGLSIVAAESGLLEEGRRAADRRVLAARLGVREARQACAGLELLERRRLEALVKRAVRGEAAELDERNRMLGSWPP